MKARTMIVAALIALFAAMPLAADGEESITVVDESLVIHKNGYITGGVTTSVDLFTDEFQATSLGIQGEPSRKRAEFGMFYIGEGRYFMAWDQYDLIPRSTRVALVYRVDDHPSVDAEAVSGGGNSVFVDVEDDSFLDELIGAQALAYRVGEYGDVFVIEVPEGIGDLVAEFRRRVAEQTTG